MACPVRCAGEAAHAREHDAMSLGEAFEVDIVDPVEPYPSSREGIENLIPSPHPVTRRSVEHG